MATIINGEGSGAFGAVPENRDRLFLASCIALIVTSMTFAIRAGILTDLALDPNFGLGDKELGWVNSMAFYGFPVAMIIGGAIYNKVGPKTLMIVAFVSHLLGLVLTMTAGGFWGLIISTFLIGFANGSVEAACNPLIADMYPDKQGEMLNKFHVWFPGGIVIGSVIAYFLGSLVSWQVLIGTMLVPTLIYGVLIFGQPFPKSVNLSNDTSKNFSSLLTPLFFIIAVLMTITATTEFGATQWVERILGNAGANPMILLAMTAGIMATGRYFAGPLINTLNTTGVLVGSAVLACIGLFMLSTVTGGMVYVATAIFALGICYFWPNMLGFTAKYLPSTGALGLSLIGGAGMLGAGIWNPIIGGWIENNRSAGLNEHPEVIEMVENHYAERPDDLLKIENLPSQAEAPEAYLVTTYNGFKSAMDGRMKDLNKDDPEYIAIKKQMESVGQVELIAGQGTLGRLAYFPLILIGCFTALYFYMRGKDGASVEESDVLEQPASAH